MANGLFKKKSSAKSGVNPSPRLLVAGWIGSMVLVALLTVLLTYEFSDESPAPAAPAPKPVAQTERTEDIVTSSPDTQIEDASKPSENARAEPPEPAEAKFMPGLKLVGRQGIVALAGARLPPGEDVAQWCRALAGRVDGVSRGDCMIDAFVDSGDDSVNGRPLVVRDIEPSQPGRGRVMLIASTHGDEPSSVGIVFDWMKMIADSGSGYDWRVLPVLNPDGLLHKPSTRVNANGVDLNRNLPTVGWAKESRDYWRRVGFEKRRFPGESAGSEPENQWLSEQIKQFQPNVIITVHAPYGVLDYDGDFPPPQKLGRLGLHRLGVYPGSLGNYGFHMNGIPVVTIELENAEEAPGRSEASQMFADLDRWLDRLFRDVRQASADAGGADAG